MITINLMHVTDERPWSEREREHRREYMRKYNADHAKWWAIRVRYKYGMTLQQVADMIAAQGTCCAICREPLGEARRMRHIDHDHKTGKVRGVLCPGCNTGLGKFDDSPEMLERAASYLRNGGTQ